MTRVAGRLGRSRQRGVVLIFTLIVLLILTIGAVALMRSMNTALFNTGNLAFRRDLVNQGEFAVSTVLADFQAGGALSSSASTTADDPTNNYSASVLPTTTNSMGIPDVLFATDGTFNGAWTHGDLHGATTDIAIRYVIDRLCAPGTTIPNGAVCVESTAAPNNGIVKQNGPVAAPTASVYRLSVRVSGARSTQIFLQTTFTRPD